MDEIERVLREASTIALYDWPGPEYPATLHRAGYLVVGHEPDGAKHYHVSAEPDPAHRPFDLADGNYLLSTPIDHLPDTVDILATYRPPEEQLDIARDAAKLGAKCYWIEPGEGTSAEAREYARAKGMLLVEGESLAAAVNRLGIAISRTPDA